MSVVGSISIRDNATATLKGIRSEQAAFRSDVAKTKGELKAAWDRTYSARLDTEPAVRKTEGLLEKVGQLDAAEAEPSVRIKDEAGSRIKHLRGEVKSAGKESASPVVRVKDEASGRIRQVRSEVASAGKEPASVVIGVKDEASGRIRQVRSEVRDAGKEAASPEIRVKDEATSKIGKISSSVRAVGRKIASPVIRAKDGASKVLGTIGSKVKAVGSMVAKPVVALKDGATAGLSSIKNLAGTLSRGVTVTVGLAGAGLAAVLGGALSSGADLEQNIGGIETLFKDSSGIVKANADRAFMTAGLSANSYMETVTGFSASLLQSLGGDTAKAADMADMAIVDMADNANKMGTSMESIQNAYSGFAKQNYTMLDNLKLGYGGTKEEMQRLLGDAQKISGVKYDISSLADIYSAIHVVQESLDITGTTAKEAGETFSGSFAAMKSAVSNLLGNLATGGDVEAAMSQVVDSAVTFLAGNALPMIGNVLTALPGAVASGIKKAAPRIRKAAPEIIKSLKEGLAEAFPSIAPAVGKGIDTAVAVFPAFVSGIKGAVSAVAALAGGFAPVLPQLAAFGGSMVSTIQGVAAAWLPALSGIVSTVQTVLPVVLPIIETVVTAIGSIIAQAAPVIGGLISGIGTVVTELAPVFSTIFTEIGEKVGSVIGFVSERMGFIQEVIGTVAPAVGDVISTAWGVISPVMDIVISVFEILFGVVQKVFPGIQSVIESVWGVVKPIVEGIGEAVGKVAGWFGSVADAFSGSGGGDTDIGRNASGDNNWKGGLTWVGEEGPELVDLPGGSRILPSKESMSFAGRIPEAPGVVKGSVINVVRNTISGAGSGRGQASEPVYGIMDILREILEVLRNRKDEKPDRDSGDGQNPRESRGLVRVVIQKIADQITVRDEDDIDDIADKVAKKVLEVVLNMG